MGKIYTQFLKTEQELFYRHLQKKMGGSFEPYSRMRPFAPKECDTRFHLRNNTPKAEDYDLGFRLLLNIPLTYLKMLYNCNTTQDDGVILNQIKNNAKKFFSRNNLTIDNGIDMIWAATKGPINSNEIQAHYICDIRVEYDKDKIFKEFGFELKEK